MYVLASSLKYYLTMKVWVYFWALCSVPLIYVSVFMPIHYCLITITLQYSVMLPALFFFLRLLLLSEEFCGLKTNFRIMFFYFSEKMSLEFWEIALSLYIVLWEFLKRFYLFIFRVKGMEGEREGEKHQCVVASHASPTGATPTVIHFFY